MKREKGQRKCRHVGIRWRMFAALAAFVLMMLVAVWVFQIRLLGFFYEKEKFSDMEELAESLTEGIASSSLSNRLADLAREKQVCISILRVEAGKLLPYVEAEVANDCVIHHLSEERLYELYGKAVKNGGTYNDRLEFRPITAPEGAEIQVPGLRPRMAAVNALYLQVVDHGGEEYLMLLDCELTPLGAIIRTLQVQFFWIVGALLAFAVLFAFLLSRMISRPLAIVAEGAKRLGSKEYQSIDTQSGYREVQELAETLNYAAREIEATDRLQKELIANISHDLRTPLTMIKGYSEVMRDIPGENTPENLQTIIDEVTRLSELVSDLTDLSRLQAGVKKPQMSVFDLTETVRDTMKRYDTLIAHEGYRILFDGDEHAPVLADRTMLLQVVYNLIGNAVNYTGESRRVVVRQEVRDGRVRLSVADDGAGIPPEQIAEIWNRYYRVDKVHKRAVAGSGLGLSIVKSVLDAHGATYGVDSAVGVGSVFWFELMLYQSDEKE